jgi:hypothetical protein
MNLTIQHCYNYLRSLDLDDVCGIRGNPWQTLIARVAKHASGKSQGFAYDGGDTLCSPEGYKHLSPQVAKIAQAFEDCKANDFRAYPVDENGLTYGVYIRLTCGQWFDEYRRLDCMKAYSPDMYNKYYKKSRKRVG